MLPRYWRGLSRLLCVLKARDSAGSKSTPKGQQLPPQGDSPVEDASGEEARRTAFVSDVPLTDQHQDRFDRWPFSKRLADAIASQRDPRSIVVAVYGAWGDGKTTALNFVEKELGTHDHILCIKFNPWRFGDEGQLLRSFFNLLAEALDRSLATQKEKIGEFLKKYGTLVAPLSLSLPGVAVSPGQAAAEIGKHLSCVDLDGLRQRIESILAAAGKRVVILMDDIDRLDKSEIYAVFKLVKLTADFSHTAYVLAFDDIMVANALQERYSSSKGESGFSFLEKIVQVPLHLPRAGITALRALCFEGVDYALKISGIHLDDQQTHTYYSCFVEGIEPRLTTPRMCRRYGNSLSFALPILKGEAHPVDLMLLEGLRVFYPIVYGFVRSNPSLFQGAHEYRSASDTLKDKARSFIEDEMCALSKTERNGAMSLLKRLFPKFSGLLGDSAYGPEWLESWSKEQRVCSPDYFDRYFTYAVPVGDVSDSCILQFLRTLSEESVEESAAKLHVLIDSRNADKVIQKLRGREDDISPRDSSVLAMAIVSCGDAFPNPRQMYQFQSAWSQAAILVSRLLQNISDRTQRLSVAKEVIQAAAPLSFCVECLRWLSSGKDDPEDKRAFSKEDEAALGHLAASRIEADAKKCNLFEEHGKYIRSIISIWFQWGNPEDVRIYLLSRFNSSVSDLLSFLDSFRSTAWTMDTGVPRREPFLLNEFNYVAELMDPAAIMDILIGHFGEDLRSAKPAQWGDDAPWSREQVAFQFAGIFNLAQTSHMAQNKQDDGALPSEPTSNLGSDVVPS